MGRAQLGDSSVPQSTEWHYPVVFSWGLSSAQRSKIIFLYVWYLARDAGKADLSWEPFHFHVVSGSLHMFSLAEGLDFLNGSSEVQEKKVEAANLLKGQAQNSQSITSATL